MKAPLLSAAATALALTALPAWAQEMDHSLHGDHAGHGPSAPASPPEDHSQHGGHPASAAPATPAPVMDMDHSGHTGHTMPPAPTAAPDPHAHHRMPGMTMPGEVVVPNGPPPAEALSGPAHAADTVFPVDQMAAARAVLPKEMGRMAWGTFRIDRLELQSGKGRDGWLWDADLHYGGDRDKLWLKSEGHAAFGDKLDAEVQALWSRAIGPWFDLQAGVRQQLRHGPDRTQAVLGFQGLAPYFFEIDGAAFLSTKGELTGRIEAEYEQRITQRLILQPRVEANLSAQAIPELGLGSGLTSLQAGARLRYEIIREFAPYIGVEWQRDLGETARMTRAAGDDPGRVLLVAGLRAWF